MKLPVKKVLETTLLEQNKASNITLRYRLWQSYNLMITPTSLRTINTISKNTDLDAALQVVEDINAWHPEWLTHYVNFDLDMYTACTKQSRIVVNAFYDYQIDPVDEKRRSYENKLLDLRQLSALAREKNHVNKTSRILLGLSFSMMCGFYFACPSLIIPALSISVLYAVIVNLYVMSVLTIMGVPVFQAPIAISPIDSGVIFAASMGIMGLILNICNPSPQGSVKLANAMDDLITICEKDCPKIQELDSSVCFR